MWTSSVALNGLLGCGRVSDWATHGIEHAVSALYDVTHGVGLAILIPSWMEYVLTEETRWKFVEYAQNVWQIQGAGSSSVAQKGIEQTRDFFVHLGMPTTLREVGVQEHDLEKIAEKTVQHGEIGKFKKLGKHDVRAVLKQAF
jgi:hypothetical protein